MSAVAGAAPAPDPYQPTHGSTAFHVEHYDLDLTYRVAPNKLSGTATVTLRVLEQSAELALDLVGLTVDRVALAGGTLARWQHRAGRLVVRLATPVPPGTALTVTVRYGGNPRPLSSPWGLVGWEELADGVVVASQPTGAPTWFPCNDSPWDKATYRTSLTVDNPYRVAAHGELVSTRVRSSTTTWVHEERHPTAAYLATVQIGQYEEVALAAGPVVQRALVPRGLRTAVRARLDRHGELMDLFTRLFGPYPFAGYTLVVTPDDLEIPLEAQGMSVFGANHLLAADADLRLVPHELAHQWFGNAVSVASWRDIWLNEGFACYAEWLWAEASGGPAVDASARAWHQRLARLPQDLVLADPGYERIFDDRVYKRGALTLHALRAALKDPVFFGLVRAWTARYAGTCVSTADFRALCREHAAASGGERSVAAVDALLARWLDEPALPALPTLRAR